MILAAYSYAPHHGSGGGIVIHWYALAVILLCAWGLIREYKRSARYAAKVAAREECASYGHDWKEPWQNPMFPTELIRDCRRCKAQEHTRAGQWPAERS